MRVFIAIEIPPFLQGELSLLCSGSKNLRWTKYGHFHLTLSFIGDVSLETYYLIKKTLDSIYFAPFKIRPKGIGHFKSGKRPKCLWIGIEDNQDLIQLKKEIDDRLKEKGISFDRRKFFPHMTLCRIGKFDPYELANYLQTIGNPNFSSFEVEHFSLLSSKFSAQGPLYQLEEAYHLEGPSHLELG